MSTQPPPGFRPGYGTCSGVSEICPVEATIYGSRFNLGGNVFFAVIFSILFIAHCGLGIRFPRTWPYVVCIAIGALFEALGYIARSVMHQNPWNIATLSLQICCLFWGPTFVCAGMSLTFKHIVNYCGSWHSPIKPKWIPWIFVGLDVMSVLIQGIGGIISSVATGDSEQALADVGSNMLVAGVSFQVANMVFCGVLILIFAWRYKRGNKSGRSKSDHRDQTAYEQDKSLDPKTAKNFRIFIWSLTFAYTVILIRCIYRVPEMAGGWANKIMRDEASFLVLDGTMVALSLISLAVFHPGVFFPSLRNKSSDAVAKVGHKGSSSSEDSRLQQVTKV